MNKAIKICCLASALTASVLMLGGCRNKDGYNSKKHIEAAVQYMNDRYGVKFHSPEDNTKVGSGDVFGRHSEYVNITVSCDGLPGKKITVFSNDGIQYFDDYVCMKYEDRAHDDILKLSDEIYGGDEPAVVLYPDLRDDLTEDMTYEEYMKSGGLDGVTICVDDRDDEVNKFRTLVKTMIKEGINCSPEVIYLADYCYEGVAKHNDAPGTVDLKKQCGEMFLNGMKPVLDEEFDNKVRICGNGGRSLDDIPLEPAPDETEETFDKYFMTIDEYEKEKSESKLNDTDSEPETEEIPQEDHSELSKPETEKVTLDDPPELIKPEIEDITLNDHPDIIEPDMDEGTHKPISSISTVSMPELPDLDN